MSKEIHEHGWIMVTYPMANAFPHRGQPPHLDIHIDGAMKGSVNFGECVSYQVATGDHEVIGSVLWQKTDPVQVTVWAGTTEQLECGILYLKQTASRTQSTNTSLSEVFGKGHKSPNNNE
jgi:hypothetical protein